MKRLALPLTAAQGYERLLKTIPASFPDSTNAARVRALVETMRWSGLAIRDTVTLEPTPHLARIVLDHGGICGPEPHEQGNY